MVNQKSDAASGKDRSACGFACSGYYKRVSDSTPEPLTKVITRHGRAAIPLIPVDVIPALGGPSFPRLIGVPGMFKPPSFMVSGAARMAPKPLFDKALILVRKMIRLLLGLNPFRVSKSITLLSGFSPAGVSKQVSLLGLLSPVGVFNSEALLWCHNARPADKPAMENRKPRTSRLDRANKIKFPFGYQAEWV